MIVIANTVSTALMDWKTLLALNYDLLLQYPIHRLPGNRKILRTLDADGTDALLVAEETVLNEALDLIENLSVAAETLDEKQTEQQERLQKILPLLQLLIFRS